MNFANVADSYDLHEIDIDFERRYFLTKGTGYPIVFLHGFPDHPFTFHAQVDYFNNLGFKAFIPYMRGYSPVEIIQDHKLEVCEAQLGLDVIHLMQALKIDKAILIGHDWGCAAAYAAAILRPDLIARAVTLGVPYGDVFFKKIISSIEQQKKSWYYFLLSSPLGELALLNGNFSLIGEIWEDWTKSSWKIDPLELNSIKQLFKKNQNYKLIAEYYRSFCPQHLTDECKILQQKIGKARLSVPWLYLHGDNDQCIDIEVARSANLQLFDNILYKEIGLSGHFLHRERPDVVNGELSKFILKE
ncbi:MAG: alpha/beta hydrolase [Flavobacterium sp.]|nr:MAG: alpha/beta hydrolase [Flavobacterium sp.]